MSYSDFIVLLARQRSGTNPLRAILGTNPDIFCFNEVFSFGDQDSENEFLRDTNFFTFLKDYARGDVRRAFPDKHASIFVDFLEYLRCFSGKRYLLIDIKYNSTQFLTLPWKERELMVPELFKFIVRNELKLLHLTRRNYLRYILSIKKARVSRVYAVENKGATYEDLTQELPPAAVIRWLEGCRDEDRLVEEEFRDYSQVLTYDYADIFRGGREVVAPEFLEACSVWLGVPNQFERRANFKKQSSLSLPDSIENFTEIEEALRGTEFEYCLEDEPIYRPRTPARAPEMALD